MKKIWKRILIIIAILIVLGVAFMIFGYYSVHKSQKLEGNLESIPSIKETANITEGTADWPNWRGPNYDGKSLVKDIKTDWTNGLSKKWEVNYLCQGKQTATWSAPVILGNRLVVPGRDETQDLVFCINTDNGELIWQNAYEAVAGKSHGPGPRATPFIDSNYVYTYGRSGDLVCWQMEDGNMIWRQNVNDLGGRAPEFGHSTSPVVYKDIVVVQAGGEALVCAFNKLTGELKWKSLKGNAGFAALIMMETKEDTSLLVYHALGISNMNPDNGEEYWRIPWEFEMNATTPAVSGDIIFNTAFTVGCQATKFTKDGFEVLWKNETIEAHHSDPIILDGYIYGYSGFSGANRGTFKCVDLKTGEEKWSTKELGQGTCTFADGHIICMDVKGNLSLIEPNPESLKIVGDIPDALGEVRYQAWTVPVIANGNLYVRYLQTLVCYELVEM